VSFSVNFCRRSLRSIKVAFRQLQHRDNATSVNSVTGLKTPSQHFFLKRVSFTVGVKLCATIVNRTSYGLNLSTENLKPFKEEKIYIFFPKVTQNRGTALMLSASLRCSVFSLKFTTMLAEIVSFVTINSSSVVIVGSYHAED